MSFATFAILIVTFSVCQAAPAFQQTSFSSFHSNGNGDNGQSKVHILVSKGRIMNHSSGPGSVMVNSDGNSIYVRADGQELTINDVNGPYVVTNEADGRLKTRPLNDEDIEYVNQQRQQFQQQQQMMQNFQRDLMRRMADIQTNIFSNMPFMFPPMGMRRGGQPFAPMPMFPRIPDFRIDLPFDDHEQVDTNRNMNRFWATGGAASNDAFNVFFYKFLLIKSVK